jgi:hypothetical protein
VEEAVAVGMRAHQRTLAAAAGREGSRGGDDDLAVAGTHRRQTTSAP